MSYKTVELDPCEDPVARVRKMVKKGQRVLSIQVEEYPRDVTSECTAELVRSRHSEGYYCSVIYKGRSILALGIDDLSKCILKPGYRIVKAENASVSFRVLRT